ncbi:MAG: hypothetical protein AB1411_16195 [Nitrospirota bacterium]
MPIRATAARVVALSLSLIAVTATLLAWPTPAAPEVSGETKPQPVPVEEYPIYDRVVRAKFLTSQTRLVLIQRLTVARLGPAEEDVPSRSFFSERSLFQGGLSADLLQDFIRKAGRPSRVEARFDFGVRYRFVTGDGAEEEPVVALPWRPARFSPVQDAPATVGRLGFSRVGFNVRGDRALVYVEENRPDGTGGGLLMLLRKAGSSWEFVDTEVLWVARRDGLPPESP